MSSEEKIKQLIREKFDEAIIENGTVIEKLGADSLDRVELIIEFEKEFNIIIHDDEAVKFVTVQDIILAIDSRLVTQVKYDELSL